MPEQIASEVFDRGRRGEPLLGCDCITCFGYCLVNQDIARRDMLTRGPDNASEIEIQNDC